jgi:hypothetical protein
MIYMGVGPSKRETVSVTIEPDGGALILTAAEKTALDLGQEVVKRSGDCNGHFKIVVKMTRPKTKAARFRGL